MKVLVLGGNGFIGRNVVDCFRRHKCTVATYDLEVPCSRADSFCGDVLNRCQLARDSRRV